MRITISGAAGKMGRSNIRIVSEDKEASLEGALEATGCSLIGSDAGDVAGCGKLGIHITDNLEEALGKADVLIDFSSPSALDTHLQYCLNKVTALVIGTTGLSEEQLNSVKKAGQKIPVIWAPNYSIGVNLIAKLSKIAAETLGKDFDAEIVETHHKMKKDSPSGTAMLLLNVLKKAISSENVVYGREGIIGERPSGQIGVLAVRGGDVVGDHTVHFLGLGERIEITHRASSRETFSRGALRAAKYILSKGKGFYTMEDVLGF